MPKPTRCVHHPVLASANNYPVNNKNKIFSFSSWAEKHTGLLVM